MSSSAKIGFFPVTKFIVLQVSHMRNGKWAGVRPCRVPAHQRLSLDL